MSRSTPGPWIASDYDVNYVEIDAANGEQVGEAYSPANGRLIAAAPELLEALTLLLQQVDASGNGDAPDFGWPKATQAARAAIAKAEGQS